MNEPDNMSAGPLQPNTWQRRPMSLLVEKIWQAAFSRANHSPVSVNMRHGENAHIENHLSNISFHLLYMSAPGVQHEVHDTFVWLISSCMSGTSRP